MYSLCTGRCLYKCVIFYMYFAISEPSRAVAAATRAKFRGNRLQAEGFAVTLHHFTGAAGGSVARIPEMREESPGNPGHPAS